jgi:putative DeoR family transcriptional regulator (stage III sporulation protein D)
LKDYIEERAIGIANYIIDHNATVRQTAKAFGISKSTVHKDVTERLAQLAQPGDLILTIGAGDIYLAGEALLKREA